MQKEIETEGETEEKAFDKFMCYCSGNTDGMKGAAEAGVQKAAELGSKLEALKSEKAQLDQELKDHQASREAAQVDSKKAANLREKEKAEFEAAEADMTTNIGAMKGAIAALEKGMGFFLQMGANQKTIVQRMVSSTAQLDDFQRDTVMGLLQGKETAQSSGEITGMLKAMLEEMEGDLATATKDEETSAAGFEELSAAKASEISSATAAIEAKTGVKRKGVKGVFEALEGLIPGALKSAGKFTIPGLTMIKLKKKPATKAGKRFAFGKEVFVKAKPARTLVKCYTVKALKDEF